MGARLFFILMLLCIGIFIYGGGYVAYRYYKKNAAEWEKEKAKLRKMSWVELILSGGAVMLTAVVGLVRYSMSGGNTFISVISFIIVALVMELYIVARRGGSVAVVMFAVLSTFYIFIIGIFTGVPEKSPIFTLNNTEITLAHTTVEDLLKDGFDIYITKDKNSNANYDELISSGTFEKYSADRSVYVEKGYRRNNAAVENSPYLLVKEDIIIGGVWLYGSESKDTLIEDCRIIHIRLNDESIEAIRENSISCKLNGLDLLAPLNKEKMKKTFGKNIWLNPDEHTDITKTRYGIAWESSWVPIGGLFWNEYYSVIDFDESGNMDELELSTDVARDKSLF